MFAPSHSLLINTGKVLARVDLAGKRRVRVANLWCCPSHDSMSPVAVVTHALKLSPRRPGRVWVLSADFWTEAVTLPADLSAMLSGDELIQALALEAEADSGHSAFESRTAALRIEEPNQTPAVGEGRWWVTQVSLSDLDSMSSALGDCGARLGGVAHPAAAQLIANQRPTTPAGKTQGTEAACQSVDFGSALGRDASSLEAWRDSSPLMNLDCERDHDEARRALEQLALQWANCFSSRVSPSLVITATRAPLSQRQQVAVGAALVLLTACGCAAMHWHTLRTIEQSQNVVARLEEEQAAQDKTIAALKSSELRINQIRTDVSKAQMHRQKLERDLALAEATHAQQGLRWVALLDALSQSTENDCWLQRLESKPAQAVLSGLAIDNSAAHRFASALEYSLRGSGWVVLPAETRLGAGDLVAFKIVLEAKFTAVDTAQDSGISASGAWHASRRFESLALRTQPSGRTTR